MKVHNLDELMQRINRTLHEYAKPKLLQDIAIFSKTRIFNFTKAGKSLAGESGKQEPLKKLKPLTIRLRKWYEAKGHPVGSLFSAARSNLTMTGQMLNALVYKVWPSTKSVSIYIEATQRAKEIRTIKHKTPEQLTNAQVARKVSVDRPFMGMDELGKRRIIQMVRTEIRNEIRKNRLRK